MPSTLQLSQDIEHSLVLVKPDGYRRGLTGEVIKRIERKGYKIVGLKVVQANDDLLSRHYAEHKEKHFFKDLLTYMSSGPMVAIVVEGERVIEGIRLMMGQTNPTLAAPGTIRGDFGRDWGTGNVENIVHGSDSPTSAEREIEIWFPEFA